MTPAAVHALPAGWGHFALAGPSETLAAGAPARSYAPDGVRLAWWPDEVAGSCACDIEWNEPAAPPVLAGLVSGGADFWRFWVLAEVTAKLLDLPILEWVRRHRAGHTPELPADAEALVVPGWGGRWTLAFGRFSDGAPSAASAVSPLGPGAGRIMTWAPPTAADPSGEVS